jgi:hypothetical protein
METSAVHPIDFMILGRRQATKQLAKEPIDIARDGCSGKI